MSLMATCLFLDNCEYIIELSNLINYSGIDIKRRQMGYLTLSAIQGRNISEKSILFGVSNVYAYDHRNIKRFCRNTL